jgi:hypothetical protein
MNLQQGKADSEERGHAIQEKQVERPAERDQQRARKTATALVGNISSYLEGWCYVANFLLGGLVYLLSGTVGGAKWTMLRNFVHEYIIGRL